MAVLKTRISSAATRPFLVDALEKVLRDDALERFGKGGADLVLLSAGKTSMMRSTVLAALGVCSVPKTRWPVLAAVRASSMVSKSRISPTRMMSGSSRSAPRSAGGEGLGVHADFAVVDEAVLALVHELDRVFHRDDVVVAVLVGVIHHRRERGGFAGAGRAGDDDQALVGAWRTFSSTAGRRELQNLRTKAPCLGLAEHGADAVLLVEEIGAEAGDVRDFVAEVHVAGFFKDL